MSKILQAVYHGRYSGGTLHLDNGMGKPLCYKPGDRDNPAITWMQVITAAEPTCTLCKRRRRAIEREPLGAA